MDPVEGQLGAFNDRDIERFLSYYDAHAVFEDGSGNVLVQGHEDMRQFYGALFANSSRLRAEVVNRIRVGPYIIDEERLTGAVMSGFSDEMRLALVYRLA